MPHEGGETDVLSHAIYNITRQLNKGKTARGRKLEPKEIERLKQKRERVRQQLRLKTLRSKPTFELRDKLERQGVDPTRMSREQLIEALTEDDKDRDKSQKADEPAVASLISTAITNEPGNHSRNPQQEE